MHRHRIRAFVTGTGETDVPVAIFATGQFLRFVNKATGIITSSLGPGTTTINALATWGDTTGTQLLNTSVLLDSSGHMTDLVTLDGQDAPNITAKVGTDPSLQEITVWASTSAPWKLGRSGAKLNPGGDMTDVNTLNGRSPGILVGRSPTSSPTTNKVMVSEDGTGIVARGTPVEIDAAGNITGVLTINGTTPGGWVVGPPNSQDTAVAVFVGTTGKVITDTQVNISNTGDVTGVLTLDVSSSMTVGTTINGRDPDGWVEGPGSATNNRVATFNGTTGKLIQQTSVAISSGDITGVTSINTIDPSTWVVGPASATSTRIAIFNGTTGKLIQESSITASGGALASVSTINSINPASWVVGPSSATDNRIARFDGTTGKLIQNSSVTIDDSGNASGLGTVAAGNVTAGTYNGVTVEAHAVRHAPSGGDPFITEFIEGDAVCLSASGTAFSPRQVRNFRILSGSIGTGSPTAPSGSNFEIGQRSGYNTFYHVEWNLYLTFGDSSVSVSVNCFTDDNDGYWAAQMGGVSGAAALGSSGTLPVGGTAPSACLRIVTGVIVPSGTGTFGVGITLQSVGAAGFSVQNYGTVLICEGV